MASVSNSPAVVQVKAQPNVYTVLLIVAILIMAAAIAVVLMNLMSPPPAGYGLKLGDIFSPFQPANIPAR